MNRCDCRECSRVRRTWRLLGGICAAVMWAACAFAFLIIAYVWMVGQVDWSHVGLTPADPNVTQCYELGVDQYGNLTCTGWEA